MKDLVKTGIVLGIVFFIILIYFLIIGNVENGVNFFTRTNLTKEDAKVVPLFERINGNNSLRKAKLVNEDLTSDDVVFYVFDHLKEDDYKVKKYEAEKIVCRVTDTISFNTESKNCNVLIIDHQVFYDYQEELYNIDTNIEFKDIVYHGYNCKTDKNKYYCIKNKYNDEIVGYSAFKEAYEEKNMIVLYEFYLRIDLNDEEMCLKYFDSEYCQEQDKEKKDLNDDVIINNGVLYRHVFKKNDDSYYLEESAIVAER